MRDVQNRRTATANNPPPAGSLLPGQFAVEMGVPTRLWVGVDAALDATQQKLLIDTSIKGGVTTGDVAPANPNPGDLWWDSVGGNLFVRYQDPNSTQWVIANTGGGGSSMAEPVGVGTWGRVQAGDWQRSVATAGDTMTGPLTIQGSSTRLILDGPAGTSRDMAFRIGGQDRWLFHSDAGNDFALLRFLGSASYDSVMFADYATGAVQFGTALNPGSVNVKGPLTSLDLTIRNPVGSLLVLDRPAGQWAVAQGTTAGVVRWAMTLGDGSAETGANAGSNFGLFRYDDLGVALPNAITANRATGVVDFSVPPTVGGVPVAVGNFVAKTGDSMTGKLYISMAGGSVATNATALEITDTGGEALMAFHRIGLFATLIGLDGANRFQIGGWSMPNQLLTLDPAGLYVSTAITSTNRVYCHAGTTFGTDANYLNYDDGTSRVRQDAGSWYYAWTIANGLRTWVGGVGLMSLDSAGNLWNPGAHTIGGRLSCNDIMNVSGLMFVANNPLYYMGRASWDGNWYIVENNVIAMAVKAGGYLYAGRGMRPTNGWDTFELWCTGDARSITMGWNGNIYMYESVGTLCFGSPSGVPWSCKNWGETLQGGACFATSYPGPSDATFKTNVQPWTMGLAEILQINTVSYQWAEESGFQTDKTFYGVTAQDIQAVLPEAVVSFENIMRTRAPMTREIAEAMDAPDPGFQMLAVEHTTIFFAMLNAIKEIDARLKAAGI